MMPTPLKIVMTVLIITLLSLQIRLWFGDGSFAEVAQLSREIDKQRIGNDELGQRNQRLRAEVDNLKGGLDAVEAKARLALGMVKHDETFFFVSHR